ncbi:MAG TPA: phospholipase D-like domain-containing protein [Candidatus Saccharimonadales bacterium]|nr:phospholipase D-like domain-containing protein [Candidatus Saccharimonadales bacterium]
MARAPKLLLPEQYIDEAIKSINQAKSQVHILTMSIIDEPGSDRLLDAARQAAKRGIDVSIAADTFTYTEPQKGSRVGDRLIAAQAMQRRLEKAGAKFHWLGRTSFFAAAGRTHSKWCVVDDTVYSFGGVNLNNPGIVKWTDFMVKIDDANLAFFLRAEQERVIKADRAGHPYRSHLFGNDKDKVLIDGGFIGDSIIYRRSCYWAKRSKEVLLVSQYCPTGRLSRLIKRVDRAQLYFNHWTNAGLLNRWVIRSGMLLSKHDTAYYRRPYLHAKFIIFTLKDGKKVAITGSHNFVFGGVMLGTREVALETTDKRIIKQLEKFQTDHLA